MLTTSIQNDSISLQSTINWKINHIKHANGDHKMPLIIYAQIQPEPLSHALPTFRTIADSYIRTLLLHFYMFVVPPKLITSKYSLIKVKCVLLVVPAVLLSVVCLLLHSFSHAEFFGPEDGEKHVLAIKLVHCNCLNMYLMRSTDKIHLWPYKGWQTTPKYMHAMFEIRQNTIFPRWIA